MRCSSDFWNFHFACNASAAAAPTEPKNVLLVVCMIASPRFAGSLCRVERRNNRFVRGTDAL